MYDILSVYLYYKSVKNTKKSAKMSLNIKKNKTALRFSKTSIAEILGTTAKELKRNAPEYIKIEIPDFMKNKGLFYDNEAFKILKAFRSLATDEEIIKMLYPKGF